MRKPVPKPPSKAMPGKLAVRTPGKSVPMLTTPKGKSERSSQSPAAANKGDPNAALHRPPPAPMPVLLSMNETLATLRIRSRVSLYRLMRQGRLRSLKIGSRRLICGASLQRLIAKAA